MSKDTEKKEVELTELEKKILKMLAPVRKDWEEGLFDPLPEKFSPADKRVSKA